jgi:uncharacterized GH25 family protein
MKFLLLCCSLPLLAHDMWIEPSVFFAENGQSVSVKLRIGENLLGDPLPRSAQLIQEFAIQDASGRRPIVGREGMDPAGFLRILSPGTQILGYYSKPSRVELDAAKFNEYLTMEGLESIAALRARKKESGQDAKESFTRCAKSLLSAGATADAPGVPLELLAEKNPYAMTAGESLPVQLIYEKRPLAGALVVAMNRMNPALKQTARTDRNGRARLKIGAGGLWMIKAVHMIPVENEYASFWASLTFEMRPAAAVSRR